MSISLIFTVLRYYRENGEIQEWLSYLLAVQNKIRLLEHKYVTNFDEFLDNLSLINSQFLTDDEASRLFYEICLFCLYTFRINQLEFVLSQWNIPSDLPFWIAKKAGLIAEIGKPNQANELLNTSLQSIQSLVNLSKISDDYTFLSQKSYINLLSNFIKHTLHTQNNDKNMEGLREEIKDTAGISDGVK
jgi:hypothetical protein